MDFAITRRSIVTVSLGLFGWVLAILIGNLAPRAENATDHVAEAYEGFQEGKCKSCHPAIWREWENSMHARAWIDEIYQEAAKQIEDRETKCDRCHALSRSSSQALENSGIERGTTRSRRFLSRLSP